MAEAKQKAAEEGLENMEELFRSMAKRGKQANISFFAFTATPKHKTLAVFGRNGQPFHRYTMRQAIEEEFIMDVLRVNPADKFLLVFNNLLETLFMEHMDQNEEIFARYMNDPSFQKIVSHWMSGEVYRRLSGLAPAPVKYPPLKAPRGKR